jgi:hypothetical protein
MRLRNPWVRLRLLRWGWNVLFTTGTSPCETAQGDTRPPRQRALPDSTPGAPLSIRGSRVGAETRRRSSARERGARPRGRCGRSDGSAQRSSQIHDGSPSELRNRVG